MDREKKLQKLNSILQEWLQHSKLWNEIEVTTSTKTKVERVKHETRKRGMPGFDHYIEYTHTECWEETIPPTEFVKVRYFNPKRANFEKNDYESVEFPYTDIDRRIEHYENKIRNLKSKIDG